MFADSIVLRSEVIDAQEVVVVFLHSQISNLGSSRQPSLLNCLF
jgi:hypothetical protein